MPHHKPSHCQSQSQAHSAALHCAHASFPDSLPSFCRQIPDLTRAASSTPTSPRHKQARHEDKPEPPQASSGLSKKGRHAKLPALPARGSKQRSSRSSSDSAASLGVAAAASSKVTAPTSQHVNDKKLGTTCSSTHSVQCNTSAKAWSILSNQCVTKASVFAPMHCCSSLLLRCSMCLSRPQQIWPGPLHYIALVLVWHHTML